MMMNVAMAVGKIVIREIVKAAVVTAVGQQITEAFTTISGADGESG